MVIRKLRADALPASRMASDYQNTDKELQIPENVVIHRLTGDGDKRILVAPLWSGNKKHVWNRIQNEVLKGCD